MIKALVNFPLKKSLFIALSLCLLLPSVVSAQSNEWWFEIEVILFKRKVDPEQLLETFKQDQARLNINDAVDLISPYIRPDVTAYRDALPYCPGDYAPEMIPPRPWFWANFAELKLDPAASEELLGSAAPLAEQDEVTTGVIFTVNQSFLRPLQTHKKAQLSVWQAPTMLACVHPLEQQLLVNPLLVSDSPAEFIASVPAHIDGTERPYAESPYLLASDSLQLDYLYKAIRKQRDLTPLLHMGWRQEVKFGRSKADNFRLFAGHNYALEYSAAGEKLRGKTEDEMQQFNSDLAVPETDQEKQDSLYAAISAALQDDSTVTFDLNEPNTAIVHNKDQDTLEQLWELDGLLKVYLQYINKVPYLHIESELDYRAPAHLATQTADAQSPAPQDEFHLQSYRLNQLRRVISKEIHYFDHPLFGVIVQIRRHQRPDPIEPEIEPEPAEQIQ